MSAASVPSDPAVVASSLSHNVAELDAHASAGPAAPIMSSSGSSQAPAAAPSDLPLQRAAQPELNLSATESTPTATSAPGDSAAAGSLTREGRQVESAPISFPASDAPTSAPAMSQTAASGSTSNRKSGVPISAPAASAASAAAPLVASPPSAAAGVAAAGAAAVAAQPEMESYPSASGTLIPPARDWALGPVPTRLAPTGTEEERDVRERRRESTLSTSSNTSRLSQRPPRPPSVPGSDVLIERIASAPSSRRASSQLASPRALRPIDTSEGSGSGAGTRSPRLPSPMHGAHAVRRRSNLAYEHERIASGDGDEEDPLEALPPPAAPASSSERDAAAPAASQETAAQASTSEQPSFSASPSAASQSAGKGSTSRLSKAMDVLKVRDFGFPELDPRHVGARDVSLGAASHAPERVSAAAARPWMSLSGNSALASGALEDSEDEDSSAWDVPPSDDEAGMDEEGGGDEEDALPLGLYAAAYEFVAESTHELAVAAGEHVRVVGALEGGWAIAERVKAGEEQKERGLVPQAYLTWIDH